MSNTRKFHIGDILSITTGYLVSPEHIGGVYNILNFMTEDDLMTHQLPRASDECKPSLIQQFPWVDDPEITVMAIGKLKLMLETETGKKEPEHLLLGWLSQLSAKYGEYHEVKPLEKYQHVYKDPVQEAVDMVGADKVVVVEAD